LDSTAPTFDPYISVTADADYIYFPGQAPRARKKTNRWRDATEEEIMEHTRPVFTDDYNDNSFFDDFMSKADPDLMKNLNPTILNALQDPSKIKKKMYIPKN